MKSAKLLVKNKNRAVQEQVLEKGVREGIKELCGYQRKFVSVGRILDKEIQSLDAKIKQGELKTHQLRAVQVDLNLAKKKAKLCIEHGFERE